MTDTTTITPEERASWRERLENPFRCHDSKHGAFTLRLLNALDTEETRANKLSSQLAKALEVNAADQMEAAIKLFGGIVAAVSGEEVPQDLSVRIWLCPHCGTTHDSKEAAVAHDATCPKHPAVVRAEQAEAELAHVRLAAGSDRYDEVTSDLIDALQKNEAENARLKWLIECMDNYEWNCSRSGWFIEHGVHHEAKATLEAARRAVSESEVQV